jgi:hypothetical protein
VSREGNSLMYQLLIHSVIDRAVIEELQDSIWFCVLFEPIIKHIVMNVKFVYSSTQHTGISNLYNFLIDRK